MNKVMHWQYNGTADITLGKDIYISPLPKIALYTTIATILALSIFSFIFKDYLYDLIINPQITLKYVEQTDNGFEVDVPYQYNFSADNFIDEVNTKEYDAFMDLDNTDYTYFIDGTIDTNKIGSYQITYNSNNKIRSKCIPLKVNVVDTIAPTIKLKNPITDTELVKDANGNYKPIFVVKDEDTTDSYLGTNNWDPKAFILDYSDNYSKKIDITYPETPNWSNANTEYKELTYIATDESGNTTNIILPLYIVSKDEYNAQNISFTDIMLNDAMSTQTQQLAQIEYNNTNNNTPGINNDGTNTVKPPQLTANSFVWSVSTDGLYGASFFVKAQSNLIYYNYDGAQAQPTSGPGITFQFDIGTYVIHWEADYGLSCDQTVTITE